MDQIKSMRSVYEVMIRETHIDMIGHVNNATYLTLYEEARWQHITERGYGVEEIQKKAQGPVILEIQIKFIKEIRLREKIRITTEMLETSGKVGKLKQQMIKENDEIASEATFTFGLFDLNTRKLIPPTPEWLKALG